MAGIFAYVLDVRGRGLFGDIGSVIAPILSPDDGNPPGRRDLSAKNPPP